MNEEWRLLLRQVLYEEGQYPPNYPVPAIPKTVVIQPDLVTIYNTYTLTEDYICPTNHS